MNNPQPEPETSGPQNMTDADRDLCLRYLLGELASDETASLESRLADSPDLAAVLMEQSETICEVAKVRAVQTTTVSHSRPWFEALIAIAACLAVAFFAWNSTSTQPHQSVALNDSIPSEQSLIAEAWASTEHQPLVDFAALEVENETDWEEVDGSSLSWVMAAVESGVSIDG